MDAPPARLELHEIGRLHAAADHALRTLPDAIGLLVARELVAHAEFGYRFGRSGLVSRVARQVLAQPHPDAEPA